jgi:hypothetical protein
VAKQQITLLTDDLDGSEASETVMFSLDGVAYEVDLSDVNAKAMRDALDRYIQGASRLGKTAINNNGPRRYRRQGAEHLNAIDNKIQNQAIREWAERRGYKLAARGRIPLHIVTAFENNTPAVAATQHDAPTAEPELEPTPTPEPEVKAAPVAAKPTRARKQAPAGNTAPAKRTRGRAKATA